MRARKLCISIVVISLALLPVGVSSAPRVTSAALDGVPSTTAGWSFESGQNSAQLGQSWSPAGDVNRDGFDDLIAGAYAYDATLTNTGRVLVFYGSADGFAAAPDWTADGAAEGDYLGISVSRAGDVNGDGFDDVLVGAHGVDASDVLTNVGVVYLYYGSAAGLSTSPGWMYTGTQGQQYLGHHVAAAGDLNGDGYDDITVGSYAYDGGETDEGRVYVFYGGASVPADSPDWTAEADQAQAHFGVALNGIGDVNGDGYDDLIIAADLYDNGTADEGAVFAWYGSADGLGDPGTPANADWMAESNQATRYFGETLGTPGDVNGDGYSEVVVSAHEYDNGSSDEGAVFVWYGSEQGINGGVNGSPSNSSWHAEANFTGYAFGTVTGTWTDINGDGYGDVVVGCLFYNGGYGAVFAYFGSETGLGANGSPANADWQVIGALDLTIKNSQFGWLAGSVGDANGDGVDDVVVSARLWKEGASPNPADPYYRQGKLWAHYTRMGVINGVVTYQGNLVSAPLIEIAAHTSLNNPPVVNDYKPSGAPYALKNLDNGSYYIYAGIDLDGSGGPPDPGEPWALYDQDGDGTPDLVEITSLDRVTGIDFSLSGWFVDVPLTQK